MIPLNKGNSARARASAHLFLFHRRTVSRPHIFGAFLSADRAVIPREKATAIGAFIEIGTVKLFSVGKCAKHSSHKVSSFLFVGARASIGLAVLVSYLFGNSVCVGNKLDQLIISCLRVLTASLGASAKHLVIAFHSACYALVPRKI